jgi:hypothetical protein
MNKPAGVNFRELKPATFVYALDNALGVLRLGILTMYH